MSAAKTELKYWSLFRFCYFINYGLVGIKSNVIAEWKIIFIFWSMVSMIMNVFIPPP
jgi:hypothetical protein